MTALTGAPFAPLLAAPQPAPVDFSRQILPILSDNCFYCHGPDAGHRKAKLRLDEEQEAKKPREGGAAIVSGRSNESSLIARIFSQDPDDLMPPPQSHKTLSPQQTALLKRWIEEGAVWGSHWSFNPLKVPAVPKPKLRGFPIRNSIDAFIADRLQREHLKPSPPADKTTLLRRLSLDLTGLPPTPQAVEEFLKDSSSDDYEKRVDRLLASPAYGERLAWDWMEVARYADSNGYQGDSERTMWPWRDWVAKAFNNNLPYDQFTLWQLAGDFLPNATQEQKLATAFSRNHPINGEGGRLAEENRVDYVMDMAETTGTVWLGLTFNCTRCHDHKFDPLTRRDYFGLFAFFNQTQVDGGGGNPQTKPVLDLATPENHIQIAELDRRHQTNALHLEALETTLFPRPEGAKASSSPAAETFSKELKETLDQPAARRDFYRLEAMEKLFAKTQPELVQRVGTLKKSQVAKQDYINNHVPRVMVMEDMKTPRKTFVLERGLYNLPGEEISAATPGKLPPMPSDSPRNRLGLAQWLVSRENPLTPRVTVNRYWQLFFGIGLVKTAEDFGAQGEPPVHPELLDWLASDFRDSGWDLKRFIRTVVTSSTYRQSSRVTPEQLERDPNNRLLARGPRYRMPSWMIRDQALAVSGLLVPTVGGPPVKPYQPSGVWEEATFGTKKYVQDRGDALYRRSLYVFWRRIIGPTMFFDSPSRNTCIVKPTRNNTPLHALTTLNDTTYVEAARVLAQRVMLAQAKPQERTRLAFRSVLGRAPGREEEKILLTAYERAHTHFTNHPDEAEKLLRLGDSKRDSSLEPAPHAAWTATCLAILNLDETLTRE